MSTQYVRHNVSLTSNPIQRNVITDVKYIIVVDCETTTDFAQKLRLAGYALYDLEAKAVIESGLITGQLETKEQKTLLAYAKKQKLQVYERYSFIKEKLYPLMQRGTALVNHNIPFDLGTLAHEWLGIGNTFYLKLCDCLYTEENAMICDKHPAISIHSLNFPKALMAVESDIPHGPILDTMTIGRALLGPGDLSLKGMGNRFKCSIVKEISEEHGDELTYAYLDYTMRDIRATLELFLAELAEYNKHGLPDPISSIMSEASIGKAYLRKFGIPPFYTQHEELPEWVTPTSMKTMYGARSEVKYRLKPVLVRYCDFKSQYPLVNGLMKLQELLTAKYIQVCHKTAEVQRLLDVIELDHLQNPNVWPKLRGLVRFAPEGDIVPNKFETVDYGQRTTGYAVCYTSGKDGTPAPTNWYTLADAIASKILTGKAPKLVDAVIFKPQGQIPTSTLNLFGDERYTIDLTKDDFFIRVIDLRTNVKSDLKAAKKAKEYEQAEYLESLQLALKLLANSTSYGVLVETRYEKGVEVSGRYFAAPVGVNITAAARLLLAIAERLGRDRGLSYAMCDTDSMAFLLSEGMDIQDFYKRVDQIVEWFNPLNPYENKKASIFELEEVNEYDGIDTPLWFLGVSCKRYVLYNKLEDGSYRIRKLSAHATGRYSFDRELPIPEDIPEIPYELVDSTDVNAINGKIKKTKFKAWLYLLWYRGIQQAEHIIASDMSPEEKEKALAQLTVPVEEWSKQTVRYQEAMSTPGKIKSHSYLPGIRPYSFLLETPATPGKHRYIMPFVVSNEAVQASQPFIAGTLHTDTHPSYDTLYNRFKDFFQHEEVKAQDGFRVGLLERRKLEIDQLAERTRTGKKIHPGSEADNQPDIVQQQLLDLLD